MDIGVIGLAVMGQNLALNMADKGYKVGVFNRTAAKTKRFEEQNDNKNIKFCYEIKELCESLKSPRKILLMVKSGEAVENILNELVLYVNEEDVVIDGGNSSFEDTERRCVGFRGKFLYLGCGISGGEKGARNGPSLMAGGDLEGWEKTKEILQKISANCNGVSCCVYFGSGGAGHFIKMVHNGIEYCEMQLIVEMVQIFKRVGHTNNEISEIIEKMNTDSYLSGYLLEITSKILGRADGIIDKIVDRASQKGTGSLCVVESLKAGVPWTLMADAVFARMISFEKEKRFSFACKNEITNTEKIKIDIEVVKDAFKLAKAVAYAQGFNLIANMAKEKKWGIEFNDVISCWKNGCILRGGFLNYVGRMCQENSMDFELTNTFKDIFGKNFSSLKCVVAQCVEAELPISSFSAAYFYLNALKTSKGGGNLIQAMRDFFGSHQVRIQNESEDRHIEWE